MNCRVAIARSLPSACVFSSHFGSKVKALTQAILGAQMPLFVSQVNADCRPTARDG